ncbi:hypothetical protein AZ66_26625 [Paenibacillus sp. E194]|uniref:ABC transporter ATP-binding protein n=1 Tax=Paenibacillus sp. E194 TaxID=1458845 RepID=UPI0005C9EA64|nr:ATP-binding cassette domain-containing protein [Paenibacillus sp. E194]KJB85122.1 hypothetical protein AZ66_26625 [Paenibacillus sp. E194]
MKNFIKVVGMLRSSFLKIYKISPMTVILMLVVTVVGALYTYANIFLSKVLLDSIVEMNKDIIFLSLGLLIVFQIFKLLLDFVSSLQTVKLSIKFSAQSDEEMIDQNSKMDLLVKEFPAFQADFSYLKFSEAKVYENYLNLIELLTKLIILGTTLSYLSDIYVLFSVIAIIVGVLRGLIDLVTVKKRVLLNSEIESGLVKPMYYYNLLTGVDSQKELTLYSTIHYYKQRWKDERTNIDSKKVTYTKIEKLTDSYKELITIFTSGVVIILVANLIIKQELSIGDYVAVTMAVTMIINGISNLIGSYIRQLENLGYVEVADEMRKKLAKHSVVKSPQGGVPFDFQDRINISNLSFTYPNSQIAALKNLSLEIKKGEMIAVLGENGSGKTTLVKLLLGLYKVEQNKIFYDDIPINDFDEKSLYQKTSAVFQDFIKYQTNVRENIAVGDIKFIDDNKRLESILQRVVFDKHLPEGLDTKLGYIDQDSTNLSGGQWQRLALSRVFIKDAPELIVFDEPTSALDPLAEVRILNDVLDYCSNTTTILISHRVGVARKADKICVLKEGRIIEFGTHDELIKNRQTYFEMWESQREWYEDTKEAILRL